MPESTTKKAKSGSGRVIRLRYAGRCGCGVQLTPGTRAGWDADVRTVTCLDCSSRNAATALVVPDSAASEPECGAELPASPDVNTTTTRQPGTAGDAAGREYQRGKDKRNDETVPRLKDTTFRQLQDATGLSASGCSMIRSGKRTPHPRHWVALALLTSQTVRDE